MRRLEAKAASTDSKRARRQYSMNEGEHSEGSTGRIRTVRVGRGDFAEMTESAASGVNKPSSALVFRNCFRVITAGWIVCPKLMRNKTMRFWGNWSKSRGNPYLLAIACVCGFLIGPTNDAKSETIGYFYALDADFAELENAASGVERTAVIGGTSVTFLKFDAHQVLAAKMGVGCVATAVSTQAVLAKFPCDLVLSVGPVGALDPTLEIGTWYEVSEVVAYQRGTEDQTGFTVTKTGRMALDTPDWLTTGHEGNLVVASGETFSASDSFRDVVRERSGAPTIDMNLHGLVSVCKAYGVPLLAWRVVSDRAGEEAGAEFGDFVRDYDGEGGRQAATVIRALPANPNRPESYDGLRKLLGE